MGIYDREYYRREGPSFLEAFHLRGQVCKWLIILNIVAYVIQLFTRVRSPRSVESCRWRNQSDRITLSRRGC